MFPPFPGPHSRQGRSLPRFLCTLAAATIFFSISSAIALEPTTERERTDAALSRAATKAIATDPQFRGLHLLVSVVDGVAVIGGAVPSESHGRLAADRIREMVPGLTEVKNRCFVSTRANPFGGIASAPQPAQWPDRFDLPGLLPGSDLIKVGEPPARPVEEEFFPSESTDNRVVVRRTTSPGNNLLLPPVVAPPNRAQPSPDGLPFSPLPPAVVAPVPITAAPPVASAPEAPVLPRPAPAVGVGRSADLLQAVEAVRKAGPRYAGLSVALKDGGAIVITGSAARVADAWEFGEAIRSVPGVTRVAMGAIEVK